MKINILKTILSILQWLLISISSMAIILSFIEGLKLEFELSSNGLHYYLNLYQPYSLLFGATFIVLTTNLAIERLGLLTESSIATFKLGNRPLWIETANYFLDEIINSDPYMVKIFKRNILNIHDDLFDNKYRFDTKTSLVNFFNKFIKDQVENFELYNDLLINVGAIYRDENYSFSYESFSYIFVNIVKVEESYSELMSDLKDLYLLEVQAISGRTIDREGFRMLFEEYRMKKFNERKNN